MCHLQVPSQTWGSLTNSTQWLLPRLHEDTPMGDKVHGDSCTHSLLCLPLVGLHFGLQLVDQVLEPEDVLAVLLGL